MNQDIRSRDPSEAVFISAGSQPMPPHTVAHRQLSSHIPISQHVGTEQAVSMKRPPRGCLARFSGVLLWYATRHASGRLRLMVSVMEEQPFPGRGRPARQPCRERTAAGSALVRAASGVPGRPPAKTARDPPVRSIRAGVTPRNSDTHGTPAPRGPQSDAGHSAS